MLKNFHLGNFKAFAKTQHIPIRPLTLIFGANSSGKSSIIHGLLLARHAIETGELDAYRTNIGGDSVDLGGFRQYIHRREVAHRVEWGIEFDVDGTQVGEKFTQLMTSVGRIKIALTIGLKIDNNNRPSSNEEPTVLVYNLLIDDIKLLSASRQSNNSMYLDRLEREHPIVRSIFQEVASSENNKRLNEVLDILLPRLTLKMGNFLPSGFEISQQNLETLLGILLKIPLGNADERITHSVADLQEILPLAFSFRDHMSDLVLSINEQVNATLGRLSYLGPLRSYPPRTVAFTQHYDPNWFAGGGYAWDMVRRNKSVRDAVNGWLNNSERLKTPYELDVRKLISQNDLNDPLLRGLKALDQDGLDVEVDYDEPPPPSLDDPEPKGRIRYIPRIIDAQREVQRIQEEYINNLEYLSELVIRDRRTDTLVSHRDIGVGVSQVLPVLVAAYASKHSIIAIEQPEIHLHPALQAELGDVFIQSALGSSRNTFLLETHSEHLILRIMRRMRNTANEELPDGMPKITPDDVAIIYVQPKDDHSAAIVQHLELDEEGGFIDPWPGGFFEEGFNERFA